MSRKSDALVARKVFEWEISWEGDEQPDSWDGCQPWRWNGQTWDDVPRYSTDIAAAWMVMEKIHEMGAHVELCNCLVNPSEQWGCFIAHEVPNMAGGCDWGGNAYAATASLAICIAALRARDVTEDEINQAMGE